MRSAGVSAVPGITDQTDFGRIKRVRDPTVPAQLATVFGPLVRFGIPTGWPFGSVRASCRANSGTMALIARLMSRSGILAVLAATLVTRPCLR